MLYVIGLMCLAELVTITDYTQNNRLKNLKPINSDWAIEIQSFMQQRRFLITEQCQLSTYNYLE